MLTDPFSIANPGYGRPEHIIKNRVTHLSSPKHAENYGQVYWFYLDWAEEAEDGVAGERTTISTDKGTRHAY